MFPGRSAKSKQAAQSHTGALVGDYATMRTLVEDAGAIDRTILRDTMTVAKTTHSCRPRITDAFGTLAAEGIESIQRLMPLVAATNFIPAVAGQRHFDARRDAA